MKKAVVSIIFACLFLIAPTAHAALFTSTQINSLLGLLTAFNVPQETIDTVRTIAGDSTVGFDPTVPGAKITYVSHHSRSASTPPPYHADAVHFDGDTWIYSTDSLGAVNGPTGIFSFWGFQPTEGSLAQNICGIVDTGSSGAFCVQAPGGVGAPNSNSFGFTFSPDGTAFTTHLDADTTIGAPVGQWFHVLMAWDTNFSAGNKRAAVYVNDVQIPFDDTVHHTVFPDDDNDPAFDIQYDDAFFSIGQWGTNILNDTIGSGPFTVGDMADLYVNTTDSIIQPDNTIREADRRKFISADGKPVDLGPHGSMPTGHAPTIFLTGDASDWPHNAAGTGAFIVHGALTDSSTSPSD